MALSEKEKQKLLADLEGKISNSSVFKKYREQRENLNKVRTFNQKEHSGMFPISLTALSPNVTGVSRSLTGIKVNVSLISQLSRAVLIEGNFFQHTTAWDEGECALKEGSQAVRNVFKGYSECWTCLKEKFKHLGSSETVNHVEDNQQLVEEN